MEKKIRKQTAQQKLNNFLRSDEAKTYPISPKMIPVLSAIASYCYYKNECNPSVSTLLEYTRYKKDTQVTNILAKLQALGLIFIEKINGKTNKYTWNVPDISDEEIYQKKPVNKSKISRYKKKTTP